ncbi:MULTISPECIES: alpha/beta hydrolase [Leuconostoc]|jgi:putative tributyrin esterase|uniref:alpha/beta hydrolase n=1 Tax=Leuconostoc TaxID=1243 RepID=UPI0011DE079B|nr:MULTISPECIES: alpha/beta hydrolase family protein [Leuconostoc]MBK0041148.1 esterase family protein [Leuconostoc sp. S51]MBK0052097.1 esterase family protein [Leuconostoc sp. S50]MBS0957795.1 esterase family protein [Leuconostoc pseudomesenteroides]MCT4412610.1 esterase family protein [Leuconostoc pseudomesenteroides]WAM38004.1 alpha/beta hydrolase family protein [Leuconostoc pseudomesenteroides]
MAFLQVNYYSQVLGMDRHMNVILPELSDHNPSWTADMLQDIPVLYLLHGMSGDQDIWQRRTSIERLVRQTIVAVVMPSTDLAWYTNTTYGLNYFDALAEELPNKVASLFPQLSTKREKNFVAGLSMGGYGAFKLGLGTTRFSYAASLSGALVGDPQFGTIPDETPHDYWTGIFGDLDKFVGSDNDLLALAKKNTHKPQLYAWIGEQDYLKPTNDDFIPKLRDLNYDITFETAPGKHEWYYWDKKIERVLEWLPINYVPEERLS